MKTVFFCMEKREMKYNILPESYCSRTVRRTWTWHMPNSSSKPRRAKAQTKRQGSRRTKITKQKLTREKGGQCVKSFGKNKRKEWEQQGQLWEKQLNKSMVIFDFASCAKFQERLTLYVRHTTSKTVTKKGEVHKTPQYRSRFRKK